MANYTFTNISRSTLSLVQYGAGILQPGESIVIADIYIRPGLFALTEAIPPILSVSPALSDASKQMARLDIPGVPKDFTILAPRAVNPVLVDHLATPKLINPFVLYSKDDFKGTKTKKFLMFVQQEGGSGADQALAYSLSDDGVSWDRLVKLGSPLPVGASYATNPCVVFDPNKGLGGGYYYQLWYKINGATGQRTSFSNDGIIWTIPVALTDTVGGITILGSTVLNATAWAGFETVFYNSSGTSYTPAQIVAVPKRLLTAKYIGFIRATRASGVVSAVAFSNDGIAWALAFDDQAIPTPAESSHQFDVHAHPGNVIKVDNYYVMFIVGGTGGDNRKFGYAVSFDLVNWQFKGVLKNFGAIERWDSISAAAAAFPTNQLSDVGNNSAILDLNVVYDSDSFGRNIYSNLNSNADKGPWSSMMAMCYWIEGNTTFAVSQGEIRI